MPNGSDISIFIVDKHT